MVYDPVKAKSFVTSIDLTGTPRGILSLDAATETGTIFDSAKNQAQVAGSGVFAFEQGVDATVREAISDSALLAQLHADKQVKFEDDPMRWFSVYGDVLSNLGWTVQDSGWNTYEAQGTNVEVNQKIVDLLTVALGAAPTALAIITATIAALGTPNSPWVTIFNRETQRANLARFQIGLVSTGLNNDVFVSLVACIIVADNEITQVLFFKWGAAKATLKANAQKVSINRNAVADLGPAVRNKIEAYQADYLSSIKDI